VTLWWYLPRMANTAFFYLPPGQIGAPSPLLADNIDPVTRDFRNLFEGLDPIDAAVQVAVTTMKGSGACVMNVGLSLSRTKMTADFKAVIEADIRQAVQHLVKRRDIQITAITWGVDATGKPTGEVDESNQTAQANLHYINLRAFDAKVRTAAISSVGQV